MRRGDVAISYIVAIVLAIITIAIIIYLFLKYLRESPLDCDKCRATLATWCSQCYRIYGTEAWTGGNPMDEDLKKCAAKCTLPTSTGCDTTADLFCKPYLPFS